MKFIPSIVVFFISFFISEINWIKSDDLNILFLHFVNASINSIFVLLLQWLLWHLLLWKRLLVFYDIKNHSKTINRLIGISQRENKSLPTLSKEGYDIVKSKLYEYNEWSFPITYFSFKIRFWFTMKPKLIYIQHTQASKSTAQSMDEKFIYDKTNRVYSIKLFFTNRVNGYDKTMKDKEGDLVLEFSRDIKIITYMRYGRDDSEKSYSGFILCEYNPV